MHISYLTIDKMDIHNWSGLEYYIAQSLRMGGATVQHVDDLKLSRDARYFANKLYYQLRNQVYMWERDPATVRRYARLAQQRIPAHTDVIFSPGNLPLALLETNKPKVFYHDSTFAGMVNYYKPFFNLSEKTLRHGNEVEQAALESCALAIYTSEWAAQTAIDNYRVDRAKVKVVPFGANIETNFTPDDVRRLVASRPMNKCRLLFLGVDWERKGGDLAVAVADALNQAGLPTELHVAGISNLPLNPVPRFVVDHGFISKSTDEGKEKIRRLIAESHFLIVPSKAECYGLVFCEASAYGVPSLATNSGGIPSAITNDVNGKTFDLSAGPEPYAAFVLEHFSDPERYRQLALSAYHLYETKLNWKVAGQTIMELLRKL